MEGFGSWFFRDSIAGAHTDGGADVMQTIEVACFFFFNVQRRKKIEIHFPSNHIVTSSQKQHPTILKCTD